MAHCSELNPRKITLSWLIMVFPWRMLQPSTGHMCAMLCSPASKSLWGLNWECTEKLAAAVIYWSCPPPILQLHWILIFQYEGSVRVKWVNAQHDRYLIQGKHLSNCSMSDWTENHTSLWYIHRFVPMTSFQRPAKGSEKVPGMAMSKACSAPLLGCAHLLQGWAHRTLSAL